MIGSGLRAVLMKVAGIGLRVEDVGKELAVMRPRLAKLVSFRLPHTLNAAKEGVFRRKCTILMWQERAANMKPSPSIVLFSTNQYSCESRSVAGTNPILTMVAAQRRKLSSQIPRPWHTIASKRQSCSQRKAI